MENIVTTLFCGCELDFKVDGPIELATEKDIYAYYDGDKYNPQTGECISSSRSSLDSWDDAWNECTAYFDSAKKTLELIKGAKGSSTAKAPEYVPAPVRATNRLEDIIANAVADDAADTIMEKIYPSVEKRIYERFGFMPEQHEIIMPDKTVTLEETTHEIFDKVLKLVSRDVSVFLQGAAGTGKNVICKQVAKALGLDFYFTNAVTQEYQLKGFIDANGHFHETQFYQAFTKGGLFFLDEMDASVPETLIILNSALANRYFDFPTGRVDAHPDFRVIAAGNTNGNGSTSVYSGRFQLDAASLDRFALIYVDYSPKIELSVAKGDQALCDFARNFREAASKCGIQCLFSYRSIGRIATLKEEFDLPDVIRMSLTKDMRRDDLHIINTELKRQGVVGQYLDAMMKLEESL